LSNLLFSVQHVMVPLQQEMWFSASCWWSCQELRLQKKKIFSYLKSWCTVISLNEIEDKKPLLFYVPIQGLCVPPISIKVILLA